MQLSLKHQQRIAGFTLAEVGVSIAVAVIFGVAAFATNERLLFMLKSQREMTAASMMLQERMEAFRSLAYSGIANASDTPSATTNPPTIARDIVANTTTSEAQLGGTTGSLSETITVSGYLTTTGGSGYPSDGSTTNQWVRNSTYPTGHQASTNNSLATNYDLIQVDIQLTWTSANGRTHNREITSLFGKGNIGQ